MKQINSLKDSIYQNLYKINNLNRPTSINEVDLIVNDSSEQKHGFIVKFYQMFEGELSQVFITLREIEAKQVLSSSSLGNTRIQKLKENSIPISIGYENRCKDPQQKY